MSRRDPTSSIFLSRMKPDLDTFPPRELASNEVNVLNVVARQVRSRDRNRVRAPIGSHEMESQSSVQGILCVDSIHVLYNAP